MWKYRLLILEKFYTNYRAKNMISLSISIHLRIVNFFESLCRTPSYTHITSNTSLDVHTIPACKQSTPKF